jgi:hypothetical protein
MIRIEICTCFHVYQDSKYGERRRVFNQCGKVNEFRCTVCGVVRKFYGSTEVKEK